MGTHHHVLLFMLSMAAAALPNPSTTIAGVEYTTICNTTLMSYGAATTNCSSLGPGWMVASDPTQAVDVAFDGLTTKNVWLNGRYNHSTGRHAWTLGRSAGVTFSTGLGGGTQCKTYCKWASGEPNGDSSCPNYPTQSFQIKYGVSGSAPGRRWDDIWDLTPALTTACSIPTTSFVYCAACERSRCTISDCPQNDEYRLKDSYYPNCKCFTLSATLELTHTVNSSRTRSHDPTRSMGSLSPSPSPTMTINNTHTTQLTPSETIHLTHTTSLLLSATVSGASRTLSPHQSATTTISLPSSSPTTTWSTVATITTTIPTTATSSLSPSYRSLSATLEVTGGSFTRTTSLSASVTASRSSSHSDQPTCESFVPMVVFHYGMARYSSSNTTCATHALQDAPVLPIQALWLGSAMDPTMNSSGSQGSVLALRNKVMRGGSCPIIPPSPFAAIDIGHGSWSKNVIDVPIGGGVLMPLPSPQHPLPEGGIPPWVFSTMLPSTLESVNGRMSFTATHDGGGVQVPIDNPLASFKVEVVAPSPHQQQHPNSSLTTATTASLIVRTTYIGPKSLNGFVVTILLPSSLLIQCVGPQHVSLTLNLQTRTLLVDSASVADGVGTTVTASSGVTGSPGSIVRGGMLTSISSLLNCEAPDLTEPISLLGNPFNIAAGKEQGQYHRGGILSGMILLTGLAAVFCGIMIPAKMVSLHKEYAAIDMTTLPHPIPPPTWADALSHTHLPGIMIVPMAITGKAWVPNGATLITMPHADAADIAAGVVTLLVFGSYLVHLLFTTIRVDTVKVRRLAAGGVRDSKSKHAANRPVVGWRRLAYYWLDSPVVLVPHGLPEDAEGSGNDEGGERWDVPTRQQYSYLTSYEAACTIQQGGNGPLVRDNMKWLLRFAPYVDELNVLWFKSVELALGNVINLVDGIVTDSCLTQGFTVIVVVAIVLAIMVIKKPLAVPAQQLTTSVVYGSMFVAAIVVVANLFAQEPQIQDVASVLFLVSTCFTIIQTVTDMLISLVAAQFLVTDLLSRRRKIQLLKRRAQRESRERQQQGGDVQLLEMEDDEDDADLSDTSSDTPVDCYDVEEGEEEPPGVKERAIQGAILTELEEEDRQLEEERRANRSMWDVL